MAMLSNYLLQNIGADAWRWMLGVDGDSILLGGMAVFFILKVQMAILEKTEKATTATCNLIIQDDLY